MELHIESLNCPNCGAPLNVKQGEDITFCLYCNSSIHISKHEDTGEHSATHTGIPPEIINEVKQLISEGKKAEAVEMYQKAANISRPEAEKLINTLVKGITDRIILERPLNAKGIMFSVLSLLIIISAVYALLSGIANGTVFKVICWVLLFFGSLNIISIIRSIIATIKFFTRKWTKATILKFAMISQKKNLSFFKVFLEVKEPGGETFRGETNIMMKTEDIAKLQEGRTIDVKYLEGNKKNIVASVGNL
jgi:uncharacterized Zn finger protein (UPF0148 family)